MPRSGNLSVLFVTTWAFTACFAVWTMFGVTGIPIRAQLNLDSTQLGLLTATPVLTGALFRLPLGIWTDRFGGRVIMLLLLVGCAVPLWISSYATALWQFLLLGLALGLVGASFSVGTPYVARFFPKESRGCHGLLRCRHRWRCAEYVYRPFSDPGLWLADGAEGLCRRTARHGRALLDLFGTGSWRWQRNAGLYAGAVRRFARYASLEILPILLDRIRRF